MIVVVNDEESEGLQNVAKQYVAAQNGISKMKFVASYEPIIVVSMPSRPITELHSVS